MRFKHYRRRADANGGDVELLYSPGWLKLVGRTAHPRGGETLCQVLAFGGTDEGAASDVTVVAEGFAACSASDNYCKRLGRDISLGRALKAMNGGATDQGDVFDVGAPGKTPAVVRTLTAGDADVGSTPTASTWNGAVKAGSRGDVLGIAAEVWP